MNEDSAVQAALNPIPADQSPVEVISEQESPAFEQQHIAAPAGIQTEEAVSAFAPSEQVTDETQAAEGGVLGVEADPFGLETLLDQPEAAHAVPQVVEAVAKPPLQPRLEQEVTRGLWVGQVRIQLIHLFTPYSCAALKVAPESMECLPRMK